MALFTPIVPSAQQHPNFARLLDELHAPVRTVIEEWAEGYSNPNRNFIRDFQSQFDPQFWELYLHAAFKHLRFDISQPDPAPDFVLGTPYGDISVEAAITSHPQGGIPAHRADLLLTELRDRAPGEIVEHATLRHCSTLQKKHEKYLKNYQALPQVAERPFVLAVAPFDQPSAWSQNTEAMFRVLFGTRLKPQADGSVLEIIEDSVTKSPTTSIPVGVFMDDRYKEISAVIFSNCATVGKARALSKGDQPCVFKALRYRAEFGALEPRVVVAEKQNYEETLLDGLCVFHNPYALRPLDNRTFFGRDVSQYFFDPTTVTFSTDASDGTLIQRFCVVLVPKAEHPPEPAI